MAADPECEPTDGEGSGGGPAADGIVVGVGNPTMRDDGLGRAVVRRLDADTPATFAGTTAFFALEAMHGTPRAVVVDAVDADGPPGTVHRYRLDGDTPVTPEVTMHDVTFSDAVCRCGTAYDLPDRMVLVGVVPAVVEGGIGVSDAVEAALPTATTLTRAELGRRTRPDGGTTMDATWYCQDCEERIDSEAVDDHEARGHSVRGRLRPERLLAQDPWETGDERTDDGGDG